MMTTAPAEPIKVGIVGGTGYAGVELLRLLIAHPQVELVCITSRGEEGRPVADMFPNLRGRLDLAFTAPEEENLAQCDVVFFATPHNVAMRTAPALLEAGTRVLDISADFRIRDAGLWGRWYNEEHACPELLEEAVYGLPELNREAIAGARLVACPGCYPTAIQLGFMPLLEHRLVDTGHLIASAASGASGGGKGAKVPMLLAESGESFKAYAAGGHRHLPEIEQGLSDIAGESVQATFVPHLIPMVRGIHASLYGTLLEGAGSLEEIQSLYEKRFADEPFVDVMPLGSHPETRFVKGANHCRIALHRPEGRDVIVVLSVIDNLVKGASGQAVQNMNIMFGLPETAGLDSVALLP
jgi:N-acetyl-gamma-glutamyl-phosphate reductase